MAPKAKIPDTNFDYMKTNKGNLAKVIRDPGKVKIINDMVERTNKTVIRAYQFIKLYFIHKYENNIKFRIIDKIFIQNIFSVITINKCKSGCLSKDLTGTTINPQMRDLVTFYNDHYSQTVTDCEIIYYDKLQHSSTYEATDMLTNINNNIMIQYIRHLHRYLNIRFDVQAKKEQITATVKDLDERRILHIQLQNEIKLVKEDLCCYKKLTSKPKYHKWIKGKRFKLYPDKTDADDRWNVFDDIKIAPQNYLVSMFFICGELEKMNKTRAVECFTVTQ